MRLVTIFWYGQQATYTLRESDDLVFRPVVAEDVTTLGVRKFALADKSDILFKHMRVTV